MIDTITVSSRGQIVIPEKVRQRLRISAGSKLVLFEKEGTLILKTEEEVARKFEEDGHKEAAGWMALAEKSLQAVWDNSKDEKVWQRYL